jgi:diguanylate cyclase (GGDEF)-like protein
MELVQGRTLRECMTAEPLSIKDAIDIAAQIAGALTAAHASGIVHRDLKPENVMVTPEGLVKVLDFGIAKREGQVAVPAPTDRTNAQVTATQAGAILGTVGYMSPEQAAGKPATFASDQFSLGAILYEMLSGRRAFQSDSKVDTLAAIIGSQPPPVETLNPRVTAAVRRVLERCMAKAPEARYPTLRDLESELLRIRGTLMPGISRRRPLWFGAATAAAAVTAISIWWSWPLPTLAVLRPVRYFRYMSIFSPQATLVGLEFQAIGVLVIAILCAGLMQTTRRDPLFYWSVGWALLSASLVAMLASGYSLAFARVGVPLSLLCEYIFGYMVFAGCRLYASGRRVGLADAWLALTAVICAGALPWWFDWDFDRFFAIHTVLYASLFIASFVAIQRAHAHVRGRAGLRAVQVALALLSISYLHYAPLFWFATHRPSPIVLPYLVYAPSYDLLFLFLLMFGMMMIVTGKVQDELELANAELGTARDRLEALAQYDHLTSALNRHALYSLIEEERPGRQAIQSGSVMFADMDQLKAINDRHGHLAGDAAIRAVASALRSVIRAGDPLFRWGGDEFLVLLADTDEAAARTRFASVNESLKGTELPEVADPVDVSVSMGFAPFTSARSLRQVIAVADEAMFRGKRSASVD